MAAHNNLLDLMTQITNLEANISAIIMEFASKLSALTDLHLFLVLENRDGRKVCGSPHLIESYAKGGFQPLTTDLLIDAESKQQRSLGDVALGSSRMAQDTDHIVVLDGDETDARRLEPSPTDASIVVAEAVDVKPNLKRRPEMALNSRDSESTRRKRSRVDGVGFHHSEFVVSHLDHQLPVGEEGDGVRGGEEISCIIDEDHLRGVGDHSNGIVAGRRFQEHLFRSEDDDIYILDFAELNLPEMKMDFLKNVENPLSLFEKGTVEVSKLMVHCLSNFFLYILHLRVAILSLPFTHLSSFLS